MNIATKSDSLSIWPKVRKIQATAAMNNVVSKCKVTHQASASSI